MKRQVIFVILVVLFFAFTLSSCAKTPDYSVHLSEIRYAVYALNGESFTGEAYLSLRETPFSDDGKVAQLKKYVIIRLVPNATRLTDDITVSLGERNAELTFRPETEAYAATLSADEFNPEKSVLKYKSGEVYEEVPFTEIAGGEQDYKKIFASFVSQKAEVLKVLSDKEDFELRLRIMRRDEKTFWYAAVITKEQTQCFLTDENGKIIAEKTIKNNA